jgi:CRISPR-associated protein Cas1
MEKSGSLRDVEASVDDLAWAERCAYWQPQPAKPPARRPLRNPARSPLILTGHGIRLRVDHGALVIRDGFTHYPQPVREHRRDNRQWGRRK